MTSEDCRGQVEALLDARPPVITSQAHLDTRSSLVHRLAELPPACTPALEQRARELLATLDTRTAPALSMVLRALLARGRRDIVEELAIDAVTAPGAAEREPFVDLLEEIGGRRAELALADALSLFDGPSDADGFLRRRMLRALASLGSGSLPAIEAAAQAEDSELVREQAIKTLDQRDARESAPVLVRRLEDDDDGLVIARAAQVLADWGHRPALASLRALALASWILEDDEVHESVEDAIERLS